MRKDQHPLGDDAPRITGISGYPAPPALSRFVMARWALTIEEILITSPLQSLFWPLRPASGGARIDHSCRHREAVSHHLSPGYARQPDFATGRGVFDRSFRQVAPPDKFPDIAQDPASLRSSRWPDTVDQRGQIFEVNFKTAKVSLDLCLVGLDLRR
jgi:hypothetical protein